MVNPGSIIILAAGFGMRLNENVPKSLVVLHDTTNILDLQIQKLSRYFAVDNIFVVVGYKKELIMEQHPELTYIYNEAYSRTNTGKSLLKGLKKIKDSHVLWLNGDVVFDEQILPKLIDKASKIERSCILVDNKQCGEEEVKYSVNSDGNINFISKKVKDPRGEALGINLVVKEDIPLLVKHLEHISNNDYFEKAIENMIMQNDSVFVPVDVGSLFCEEIDFAQDLLNVQRHLKTNLKLLKRAR